MMHRAFYPRLAGTAALAIACQVGIAAEGGYSNYVPGTYGDFAMALAPVPIRRPATQYSSLEVSTFLEA